jgi:hypothetical protein
MLISFCKCGEIAREGQRNCLACHAAAMRKHRRIRGISDVQRPKADARSHAGVYKRRGLIEIQPCMLCGDADSEMHHPDYSKPKQVLWLCRAHHLDLHAGRVTILGYSYQPDLEASRPARTMGDVLTRWLSRKLAPSTAELEAEDHAEVAELTQQYADRGRG